MSRIERHIHRRDGVPRGRWIPTLYFLFFFHALSYEFSRRMTSSNHFPTRNAIFIDSFLLCAAKKICTSTICNEFGFFCESSTFHRTFWILPELRDVRGHCRRLVGCCLKRPHSPSSRKRPQRNTPAPQVSVLLYVCGILTSEPCDWKKHLGL